MNAQVQPQYAFTPDVARAFDLDLAAEVEHSGRILAEVSALNRLFLSLLAAQAASGVARPFPDTVAKSLSLLSGAELIKVSDCPFALFALNFAESGACARLDAAQSRIQSWDARWRHFAQAALCFAWHLVRLEDPNGPMHARLLLGLGATEIATLRRTPLASLIGWALESSEPIAPRWPRHARFWPELIRCSTGQGVQGLRAIRLLGRQLLAAEGLGRADRRSRRTGS